MQSNSWRDKRELLTGLCTDVLAHVTPAFKYLDAAVDVDHDVVRAWSALSVALRRADIDWRWVAFGAPADGPGAGMTVGVPHLDSEMSAKIDDLARRVVSDVPVIVVQDDSPPDVLL